MKKLLRFLCLAAILCVAWLALTTPRGKAEPVMKAIDTETDENTGQVTDADTQTDESADQVKMMGEDAVRQADELIGDAVEQADEAIGDAVKQADEVLENAVEQADKALVDAVDSAAEGAKQGFVESLKKSASEFWGKLFP